MPIPSKPISSSLICGFIKGLDKLNDLNLDNDEILSISREVEYNFIGLKGGIMDQFTIINSKKNNLILLNTKDNSSDFIESDLGDYKLLLLNTNKKHNLSDSAYNKRVEECQQALKIINDSGHKIKFITQIKVEELRKIQKLMPKNIFNRALYVTQENNRTIKSVQYLKNLDLKSLGELMYSSHEGLRDLYEVSCDELDYLVDKTRVFDQILGARMMGGGFGGCTINLIHKDFIDIFVDDVSESYLSKFSLKLSPIITSLGDGLRYKV